MNEKITAETLKSWRKSRGMTQAQLATLMGWEKLVVTNIETGRRQISPPEQKLLAYYMAGESPDGSYRLTFTGAEAAHITRLAAREGYADPAAWITAKIRTYLRWVAEEQAPLHMVAEDTPPYPQKPHDTGARPAEPDAG